jgi:hypothetical protein
VLGRRLYGDRRIKGAYVRKGFKEWVERGFPRDPETGRAPAELMKRGWDTFERVDCAVAYALHATALENVARTYSGDAGKRLLEALKKGDQVITAGGMHGKISAVDDNVVTIEVANNVNIKFNKGHVAAIIEK